ncbi:MAG: cellulase family glycosylhydrolase [bacterium]
MDDPRFPELRNGRLLLGERPFRFVGTNCYFLQEEGARELLGWERCNGRVDEALRKAAGLGLGVVRAWAFHDSPDNPAAMQASPRQYREAGFRGMDLAIAAAAAYGVRLILCLGNYWGDYGGVPQYLRWHGLPEDGPQRFFTDATVREHYGEHVEHCLSRVNHLTGVPWGADPTILGWELLNEPRGKGLDDGGEALAAWVEELAQRVRRAAPNQLVLTGEEGFGDDLDAGEDDTWSRLGARWMTRRTGQSFTANTARVDLATIHLYPEDWRWDPERIEDAGVRWIRGRADAAAALGRPLVLGELGLRNDGRFSLEERRRIYDVWLEAARTHPGVAGALTWSFSTDDRPDDWDAFTWRWRDDTDPGDPENRYADLHRDWARRWAADG